MGWVYQIKNRVNGKCYIGQTTNDDVRKRWYTERSRPHGILKYAFNKYGLDSFEFSTIVEIPRSDNFKNLLAEREILEIRNRNTVAPYGYNLENGGLVNSHHPITRQKIGLSHLGKTVSEETREKLRISHMGQKPTKEAIEKNRQAQLGKTISEETRKKISTSNTGKIRTSETIEKLRKINVGRIQSEEEKQKRANSLRGKTRTIETKEKMRQSAFNRRHTDETKQKLREINTGKLGKNSKQVDQYTKDGLFINTFRTISEAAKAMNCSIACISNCCNGKTKTAKNYTWKFHD